MLGTGVSHDGSACLLKDGRVCVAIEKERITRFKHDGGNDTLAIEYCLDAAGITIDDLDLVVQNANFGDFERGNSYFGGPRPFSDQGGPPLVTISHHLAHAYSALGMCPFPEPKILVVDGCGNSLDECTDLTHLEGELPIGEIDPDLRHLFFEKDSYYACHEGRLRTVFKDFSPWGLSLKGYPMLPGTTKHSIGGMYNAVTLYCLQDDSDPGKLMGLAPYGKPGNFSDEIFELRDGRVFVRYDWMKKFDRPARRPQDFKDNFQHYADIAYGLQREVERALLYLVESRYDLDPGPDLAYAGGVALNVLANSLLERQSRFERIFVVPAAGDNGLALGCAYYGWLVVLGRERVPHDGTTCFGRIYPRSAIRDTLEAVTVGYAQPAAAAPENPVARILQTVHESFLADRARGWEGALCWHLGGAAAFTTIVRGGRCALQAGQAATQAVEVALEPPALPALLEGRLLPGQAVRSGLIKTSNLDALLTFFGCIDWPAVRGRLLSDRVALYPDDEGEIAVLETEDYVEITARMLAAGKIVAWFQEGSEFGPRALGRRSLLADPRLPELRDVINREIKRREDFRPFAPSVLMEDAHRYFDWEGPAPYMLSVAPVRQEWAEALKAVVHCDRSSRLQTVTAAWNPTYWALLQAFRRLTGISVLLNTSLNRKGMPIVETPGDALNFFRETTRLDALVLGPFLVWHRARPPLPALVPKAPVDAFELAE